MAWDTIFYATAEGSVPAADFLDNCPPKVRGTILAVAPAIEYVTVLVLERDDPHRRLAPPYIGTLRRSRFDDVRWAAISLGEAVQELGSGGSLLGQDPQTI